MFGMFLFILGVDEYVIELYYDEFIQILHEDRVH